MNSSVFSKILVFAVPALLYAGGAIAVSAETPVAASSTQAVATSPAAPASAAALSTTGDRANKTAADKSKASSAGGAKQQVVRLQNALIHIMQDADKLHYEGRYKYLKPIVDKVFDFPFISRVVMGPDWPKLDTEQRKQLQKALAKLSVSSFAKEFDSYSGQKFVYDSTRSMGRGKLVRYVFHSGNDRIHFDYQMHKAADGQWKIANVIVDGVSDLALKSGQYRSLYAKKGYSGLIAWIKKQIEAKAKASV